MTTIINQFEIVAPSPEQNQQQARREAPAAQQAQPAQPPRPEDVERIIHRFAQRRLRLWAD